jgi:hypothetical protein
MNAVLLMALIGFAGSDVDSDCITEGAVDALSELVEVLEAELEEESGEDEQALADAEVEEIPAVEEVPVTLPTGDIDAETLLRIFGQWKEESPSLLQILSRLVDGESRSISGDAIREAAELAGLSLPQFVPAGALVGIQIEDGELRVILDGDQRIPVDAKETYVLDVRDESDPFSVSGTSVLVNHETSSYTLHINEELVFSIGPEGIIGIRDGDLWGSKFIFSQDISLRSVHGEPGYEKLEGYVVLQTDESGEPLIVDGNYVPKEADEWLEVTAGGDTTLLGVPRLGQ